MGATPSRYPFSRRPRGGAFAPRRPEGGGQTGTETGTGYGDQKQRHAQRHAQRPQAPQAAQPPHHHAIAPPSRSSSVSSSGGQRVKVNRRTGPASSTPTSSPSSTRASMP